MNAVTLQHDEVKSATDQERRTPPPPRYVRMGKLTCQNHDDILHWLESADEELDELLDDYDEGTIGVAEVRQWVNAATKALDTIHPRSETDYSFLRSCLKRAYPSWTINEALDVLTRPEVVSFYDIEGACTGYKVETHDESPWDSLAYMLRYAPCRERGRDAQFLAAGYKRLPIGNPYDKDNDGPDAYNSAIVFGRCDLPDEVLMQKAVELVQQHASDFASDKDEGFWRKGCGDE